MLFQDARFHASLLDLDVLLADEARAGGCGWCGGPVHAAPYLRKPRGGPDLPDEHRVRFSFCCAIDGCRKRLTPPSVRFLGRKVYVATAVILVSVLRQGPSPTRVRRLRELTGVSRRTVERWCGWWKRTFALSGFWRIASATVLPTVVPSRLPLSLLERFEGNHEEQLHALLRFLGPITGAAASQVC